LKSQVFFVDLDGPLLDVSRRYHRLHRDLVAAANGRPLPRRVYWSLKRRRVREEEILRLCGLSRKEAHRVADLRLARIETAPYLAHDRTWPWALATVGDLSRRGPVVLVTLRRNVDLLHEQLRRLHIAPSLTRVLSGPGSEADQKSRLVRRSRIRFGPTSVFVGDTELDVDAGKRLGIRTVALGTGIRSVALLRACRPDALLSSLRELPAWLDRTGD
jgi:phosphoglycolate phosphatase-like HAD superfamily hydrolase